MIDKAKLKVLLVEDDAEDADIFRRHAHASPTYHLDVEHVRTSGQAFERLSHRGYDLIFLDHILDAPTTGLDVLSHLKAQGVATPVIVFTGRGNEPTAVAMMKAGASMPKCCNGPSATCWSADDSSRNTGRPRRRCWPPNYTTGVW